MEIVWIWKPLKTWHPFQESNERNHWVCLKCLKPFWCSGTENTMRIIWNNQWLSSLVCLSQDDGLPSHWSTLQYAILSPSSTLSLGLHPQLVCVDSIPMWRCVYFHTWGGCTWFTEFCRAWTLAFKGKHVSWEMDVEGHSEQPRLFLVLLHSHIT